MLFGPFHPLKDETVHAMLSLLAAGAGFFLGLYNFPLFIICFAAGVLIDVDHFANRIIARKLLISAYQDNSLYGSGGYTIKALHGFDVALLIGIALFAATHLFWFSFFIALVLSLHELWDFLVYPHSPRELLLITRLQRGFKPGLRTFLTGIIFELSSLKY